MRYTEIITETKRNDELIQQVKDLWDSGMRSPKDIAEKLNIKIDAVYGILRLYYSDRPGKQEKEKWTPELIQQVKDLWDSGIRSVDKIGASLGTDADKVGHILTTHYKDRPGKREQEKWTPELIQQVKDLWDEDRSAKEVASRLNIDVAKVNHVLDLYYPNRLKKKERISPEFIQQVKDLWDETHSATKIAATLGIEDYTKVNYILNQHYPERSGKRERHPSALVKQIGDLWNKGMRSPQEFATTLNVDIKQAENILRSYFLDRPINNEKGNLSLKFIQQVGDSWRRTGSTKKTAAELDIDVMQVKNIVDKYHRNSSAKNRTPIQSRGRLNQ